MKIGILTFTLNNNFGATLQAYALSEYLNSQGHNAFLINLRRDFFDATKIETNKITLKSQIKRVLKFSFVLAKRVINYWNQGSFRYAENDLKERVLFMDFFLQYTTHTKKYYSKEQLSEDLPDADLFIVGSDQVWNPKNTKKYLYNYFFDFLPESAKRISYAASFGGSENLNLSEEQITDIKKLLAKFDKISVREDIGLKILNNTFGINNGVEVLDPTFLPNVSVYEKIAETSNLDAKGYIFSFKFNPDKKWYKSLNLISKQTGLTVRTDWMKKKYRGFYYNPVISVADWLQLIKTADFIWTDSFHCMVFCILFHKNFVVTPSYKGGEGRLISLLKKIGLENRFFYDNQEISKSKVWNDKIDYEQVENKLTNFKYNARFFLRTV